MTFGNHIHRNFFAHFFRNMQKTQFIGYSRLTFPHFLCYFFLGNRKLLNESCIAFCFFEIIQIFSLQVFNQGHFRYFTVTQLTHQCRNSFFSCNLAGTKSAFPTYQLICFINQTHNHRLQYAVFSDGVSQFFQLSRIKIHARLKWIRRNLLNI